jgi:hypothetical protein
MVNRMNGHDSSSGFHLTGLSALITMSGIFANGKPIIQRCYSVGTIVGERDGSACQLHVAAPLRMVSDRRGDRAEEVRSRRSHGSSGSIRSWPSAGARPRSTSPPRSAMTNWSRSLRRRGGHRPRGTRSHWRSSWRGAVNPIMIGSSPSFAGSSASWAPSAAALVANLSHVVVEDTDWEYCEFSQYDLGQAVAHMTFQAQCLGLRVRQSRAHSTGRLSPVNSTFRRIGR